MVEIILDASQLEVFETCPRRWYYGYVENLIPNRATRAFDIGSYYHAILELFYALPLGPHPHPLDPTFIYPQAKDWDTRFRNALFLAADTKLQRKFGIKDLDEVKFHRQRLIDYFYVHMSEDEQIEPIAVEKGFSWLLYEDSARRYILEGKIDFVGRGTPYGFFVMDHKTQARFDDRFEFNHQVCNYMSFTKAEYFVYNYIGLQDKLPKGGIRRMLYKPHPGMLEQWQKEVRATFDRMYVFQAWILDEGGRINPANGEGRFPRIRAACDASKYGLCQYHKLCSVPDDSPFVPAVRSAYKKKEQKWQAWSLRDDISKAGS